MLVCCLPNPTMHSNVQALLVLSIELVTGIGSGNKLVMHHYLKLKPCANNAQ